MSNTFQSDLFGDESETRGPLLNGVSWALVGASSIFLAFRIYFRVKRRKSIWWDDGLMILSWHILVAAIAITTIDVRDGLGRHMIFLALDNLVDIIRRSNIASTLTDIGVGLSKASFAVTLLPLSRGYTREFLWFLMIGVMIVEIVDGILYWVQCGAEMGRERDFCTTMPALLWVSLVLTAISGIITVTLTVLPWTFLWRMVDKMSGKEKLAILTAMSLGQMAAVAAFVKCYEIRLSINSFDMTYDSAAKIIWGYAELSITIIAASIPFMHPLLGKSALDPTPRPRSSQGEEKSAAELEAAHGTTEVSTERTPAEMSGGLIPQELPAPVMAPTETYRGDQGRPAVPRKPVARKRDRGAHESKVVYG